MSKETPNPKEKTLLKELTLLPISQLPNTTKELLPALYFNAWQKEGLCSNLKTATKRLNLYNPNDAFALISPHGVPYALLNTLPTNASSLAKLCQHFPTYKSVEQSSATHSNIQNPTFLICFSIVTAPGFKTLDQTSGKELSLSEYLLTHLPLNSNTFKLAYSRSPAVGLHERYGAIHAAHLLHSRDEDLATNGSNDLMLYPRNSKETKLFDALKQKRQTTPPKLTPMGNAILYSDLNKLFS